MHTRYTPDASARSWYSDIKKGEAVNPLVR